MKNRKKPEIRFFDFVKDWESKKFSEIWIKSSERNIDMFYSPDQIISVSQMKLSPSDRESKDDYMKTYNVIHYGDIAFEGNKSKNFSFGRFVLNDLQDGIVSHVFTVYRPRIIMDIDFMKYYINNEEIMRHVLVKATTKTLMMTNLNTKDINRQKLNLPSIDEQKRIGGFLKHLDSVIETHQQELINLKFTKQGFLQKLFPIDGKKVPEIRFPGFDDDWKQGKLGDHSAIHGRVGWKSLKQEEYTDEGPKMIAGRFINDGKINWSKADHIPQWRYEESPEIALQNGDVIFTKDGSRLGNPAVVSDITFQATINGTMMLVRPDSTINSSFLYQILCSKAFNRLIKTKVSGSGIPHLFQSDMKDFQYSYSSIEEQEKIGLLLGRLDETIALHQRELALLQLTKKAFLQKLFV